MCRELNITMFNLFVSLIIGWKIFRINVYRIVIGFIQNLGVFVWNYERSSDLLEMW